MQKLKMVLAVSCAVILVGCMAAVSPVVKQKENIQSEAYEYPQDERLSPVSKAIYGTIKASVHDFRELTGQPMRRSKKEKLIDGWANEIMRHSVRREGAVSAIESYKNSAFHEVEFGDLFVGTDYSPERGVVVHGVQRLAHHTQSQIWYWLPTDSKSDAKRLAGRVAQELDNTVMPEPEGWRWMDKEEWFKRDIRRLQETREIAKGGDNEEEVNRNMDELEEHFRRKRRSGGYDAYRTTYQWYPGTIDIRSSRLTHVTLRYKEEGVRVRVGHSTPVSQ